MDNTVTVMARRTPNVSSWEIAYADIKFLYRVGIGAYGEVFRAQFRGTTVAVKRMVGSSWKSSFEIFSDELEFLKYDPPLKAIVEVPLAH